MVNKELVKYCMNWLIILLIFGCCGNNRCNDCCGHMNICRKEKADKCYVPCGCAEERSKRDERRERNEKREDIPGMIPPSWREYAKDRRDDDECNCGCDK